jgi:hypothetical protein
MRRLRDKIVEFTEIKFQRYKQNYVSLQVVKMQLDIKESASF